MNTCIEYGSGVLLLCLKEPLTSCSNKILKYAKSKYTTHVTSTVRKYIILLTVGSTPWKTQ